jgi:hypothetical protein|tara:strand:+ start:1038 stop:1484 length:447 start_codon:yes stop_codon:yes gene_type:complete
MDDTDIQINLNDENSLLQLQNILNEFQNSVLNIQNTNDNTNSANRFVIEFEFNIEQQIENLPNYFKNIKEINDILGKPIYINKKDEVLNDKECLICLEKFEYKKYKRVLKCCNNIYHKTCIDKWLKKNSTCPTCRHDYLKEENEEQNN